MIDFISVLPFDLAFEYGNMSRIVRFSRIGKIYKVIRITKMVRLWKASRLENSSSYFIKKLRKIGAGFQRILYLLVTFIILQHVSACIWIFIGISNDDVAENWIFMKGYQDYDNQSLYITSLYFTVTTIVTVGYGDITPYNNHERSFVIFLMLVGVISFSFATSTLSVLMTKYDFRNEIIT